MNFFQQINTSTIAQGLFGDVCFHLSLQQKELPCKYFYDERGSQLFEQICELEEYYLTRTELSIMSQHVDVMARKIGSDVNLIEFGSGSSMKTRLLLEALRPPTTYMPVDISESFLLETAAELRSSFPNLDVLPIVGDFTMPFQLPETDRDHARNTVYFPGSTIGNFRPRQAIQLLKRIAKTIGSEGSMLVGIDLQKDADLIERAYNDRNGITAEFNLNLLHRINSELFADFDVQKFDHLATYNKKLGRVELYLVSQIGQSVQIGDRQFDFEPEEKILTEYSHKYTIDGFSQMAAMANLRIDSCWTDPGQLFAVLYLKAN